MHPGTRLPFLYPAIFSRPVLQLSLAPEELLLPHGTKRYVSQLGRIKIKPKHPLARCGMVTMTRHGTAVPRDLGTDDSKSGTEQTGSDAQAKGTAQQQQNPVIPSGDTKANADEAEISSSVVNHFMEKQSVGPDGSASSSHPPPSVAASPEVTLPEEGLEVASAIGAPIDEKSGLYYHHNPNRYYHNFDTYAMTKSMSDAGFPPGQAKAVTKTVRDLLVHHIGLAKESHVSKSMTENENYLFRAACSELRTEVQNSRKAMLDKTRLERAQLQHDYDQLQQSFSEDLLNLKDEVSSMFNDRKMVTRAEQRAMEVKIQELNYKLTVLLSGDLRSEIESLRWVTTRRSLIALLILASVIISFIKLSGVGSQVAHEHEHDLQSDFHPESPRRAGMAEELASHNMASDDGTDGSLVSLG